MAHNVQLSTLARNTLLSGGTPSFLALFDNGYLRVYNGTQATDANTAVGSQTKLAELRWNATAFGAPSTGVAVANAITADSSAPASGTASWFRSLKSDGTTVIMDGTIDTADADLVMTTGTTITAGNNVPAASFSITMPASSSGGGGTSDMVLLESHTASGSSSLDFTSWYSSLYDEYVLEIVNLLPATDGAEPIMTLSVDGGSTFLAGTTYREAKTFVNTNSATGAGGNISEGRADWRLFTSVKNTANGGFCASYRFYNPGGAAATAMLIGMGYALTNDTGHDYGYTFFGRNTTTSAVNAFRVAMSSGNIASGSIRIYGLRKS